MATPTASLNRFEEAIAWFRQRIPMTVALWERLERQAQEKAFWVTEGGELALVLEVYEALDKAIADGETLRDFKARVQDKLRAAWGTVVSNPGERIETIFRTNVQLAYGAGRKAQLSAPAVKRVMPYWQFSSVLDSRTSEVCRPLNGTVLPADHGFWATHSPPLHHRCRSTLIPLTEAQAEKLGVTSKPPDVPAAEGFGVIEDAKGWKPDPADAPPDIRRAYRQRKAARPRK